LATFGSNSTSLIVLQQKSHAYLFRHINRQTLHSGAMSGTPVTSNSNGTSQDVSGPNVIQVADFYVHAGILHPITVGSIAVLCLFTYLRLGSNRCIAPINIFDWVINVALGSTIAGIVNGNSLVRGLLALITMLGFQYVTSSLSSRFHERLGWLFCSPPLVIAFRGRMLAKVMKAHRISQTDVNSCLRQAKILNICEVECIIIEPNGTFSLFTMKNLEEAQVDPDVLHAVAAYKALVELESADGRRGSIGRKSNANERSKVAGDTETRSSA
jgi:uncharacterized membrane protein YcaP (DUF421 family)